MMNKIKILWMGFSMRHNIKIIVSNVIEDESDACGLWDLAEEIVATVMGESYGDPYFDDAFQEKQENVYNILLQYAQYTHPDHYSNRKE